MQSADAQTTRWHSSLRVTLARRLNGFDRRALPATDTGIPASVVLAMVPGPQGEACLVLTRRPRTLRRHGGQFALPGGRREPGESAIEAGLRELDEEVGIACDETDVLGILDDYTTQSGFAITPMVVWTEQEPRIADPGEVAVVYRIPIDECAAPKALRTGWPLPVPALHVKTVGTPIFAPTAAIIHQWAELAVHGRSTRVGQIPQPRFAWR